MFSAEDLKQIAAKGMTEEQVAKQLHCFETGFPYLQLAASASLEKGGGILTFSYSCYGNLFNLKRYCCGVFLHLSVKLGRKVCLIEF